MTAAIYSPAIQNGEGVAGECMAHVWEQCLAEILPRRR